MNIIFIRDNLCFYFMLIHIWLNFDCGSLKLLHSIPKAYVPITSVVNHPSIQGIDKFTVNILRIAYILIRSDNCCPCVNKKSV